MIYAQFWHRGTSGKLIPACGSDSVLRIDRRFGISRQHDAARMRLQEPFFARKYEAYSLHSGERYSNSRPLMSLPAWPHGGVVDASEVSEAYLSHGRIDARS